MTESSPFTALYALTAIAVGLAFTIPLAWLAYRAWRTSRTATPTPLAQPSHVRMLPQERGER